MNSTETREVNIPLLRKAVEWAETEAAKPPELCEWNQGSWVAVVDPMDRQEIGTGYTTKSLGKAQECGTCFCVAGYVVEVVDGRTHVDLIPDRAAELLGIDMYEAMAGLFSTDNTIADVRRIAEDLAGERL
jgi:hypothetical protein